MRNYEAYVLDLDGVIYRGDVRLPGARELVQWLDATGRKTLYLSNNSIATPEEVAAKLARLEMPRPEERTMTAGWAAVQAVAERFPGGRIYVLALPPIVALAERAGLRPVWGESEDGPAPDAILVGLDRTLTYDRLCRGMHALLAGAAFYAVNRDPRLPTEHGFDPGTGSIVTALEYATGQHATMIGKPAPGIVEEAMRVMGVTPDEVLMIGDGLDLDIPAGQAAGVATALVLTGLTTAAQAKATPSSAQPTYIFPDLPALLAAAQAAAGAS